MVEHNILLLCILSNDNSSQMGNKVDLNKYTSSSFISELRIILFLLSSIIFSSIDDNFTIIARTRIYIIVQFHFHYC